MEGLLLPSHEFKERIYLKYALPKHFPFEGGRTKACTETIEVEAIKAMTLTTETKFEIGH